jgi:hypothetical protein
MLSFPVESKYNHMLHRKEKSASGLGMYEGISYLNHVEGGSFWEYGYFAARTLSGTISNDYSGATTCITEKIETFRTDATARVEEKVFMHAPKPMNYETIIDLPYSWTYSLGKTLGETDDNFVKYPIAHRKDMQPAEGEITGSAALSGQIYSFQESGISRLGINERAIMESTSGSSFIIGNAGVLERVDYLTKDSGTQHQWSIIETGNALYYVDCRKGKIAELSNAGINLISDTKGTHDFIESFSKYFQSSHRPDAIHGTFDYKNNDVIFTFIGPPRIDGTGISIWTNIFGEEVGYESLSQVGVTLSYNQTLGVFHGFMSPTPDIWFTYGDSLFSDEGSLMTGGTYSINNSHEIYVYNEDDEGKFFGNYYDSEVEIIINESAQISKVFDNVLLNMNPDAAPQLESIKLTTEIESQTITVAGDTRLRYKELLHRFPLRTITGTKRTRGKWLKMKLKFNNSGGKEIRLSSIETRYRPSLRI